ncbi:MAG TPA: winged helix-turn-helix domain-containing protein [Acidimicrobiales bacterium]|nr:winged helix-turn-helix domain-containing protein [Acidimicrobiales bacterium]
MVLEELALAAGVDEAGLLVAPTSARAVAERLGLTAGAVARALASLRALGLVSHLRRGGLSGRFGPSNYVLGSIPGLDVADLGTPPGAAVPCSGTPCVGSPHMAAPSMGDQPTADTGGLAGRPARRDTSPVLEPVPTMASEPQAPGQERPAAKSTGRSGRARPPRLDAGLQLELLSAPPEPATKRSQEHGR